MQNYINSYNLTEQVVEELRLTRSQKENSFFASYDPTLKTELLSSNQLPNLIAQIVIKELLDLKFFENNSEFSSYLEEVYKLIQSYIEKEMVKIVAFQVGIKV